MDDTNSVDLEKKKKKLTFLGSLIWPEKDTKKSNAFYGGNVIEAGKERKKMLSDLNKEIGLEK